MRLDDSTVAGLKTFLSQELEPICEADPTVLADYVIALLRHDKSIPELKDLCRLQLEDFLKDATEPFVQKLFQTLGAQGQEDAAPAAYEEVAHYTGAEPDTEQHQNNQDDSYQPPEETTEPAPAHKEEYASDEDDNDRNFKHTRREKPNQAEDGDEDRRPRVQTDSRSDTGNRRAIKEEQGEGEGSQWERRDNRGRDRDARDRNGRPADHKRRRSDDAAGEDGDDPRSGKHQRQALGWGPGPNAGRRNDFDRGDRGRFPPAGWGEPAGWGGPGINGSGMVGVPGFPRDGGRFPDRGGYRGRGDGRFGGPRGGMRGGFGDRNQRQRRPCRDFNEKGMCYRGDACPYDHGPDRIVIDQGDALLGGNGLPFDMMAPGGGPMAMRPPPFGAPFGGPAGGDFEAMRNADIGANKPPTPSSEPYDPEQAAFSDEAASLGQAGAPTDSTFTVNGDVDPTGGRNVMRGFGARNGAGRGRGPRQAPYGTPQKDTIVVENIPFEFCNIAKINDYFSRFGNIVNLQVEQLKQKATIKFSSNAEGSAAKNDPAPIFDNRFVRVYFARDQPADASAAAPTTGGFPPRAIKTEGTPAPTGFPDPAAVAARQEAKQKALEQKKQLMEAQQGLLAKQLEAQKKIMAKLDDPKLKPEDKKMLLEQLKKMQAMSKDLMEQEKNSLAVAKAQRATPAEKKEEKLREHLDRELDLLSQINEGAEGEGGANPELVAKLESLKSQASAAGIDTAALLQAGGAPRGRGRGRGGFGRGAGAFAARGGRVGGSYNLDNRTTKIMVKNVPPEALDEIKAHFITMGETHSIEFKDGEDFGVVHYKNRWEAEKAIGMPFKLEQAPKLQIVWYNDPSSSSASGSPAPATPGATAVRTEDAASSSANGGAPDVAVGGGGHYDDGSEEEEDSDRNWKR
ncbi:RNA-binding protein 27 [Rhizophlyctis rosea]|nr:RNA-binding protein 27 [Rhizophlyctis rosea]